MDKSPITLTVREEDKDSHLSKSTNDDALKGKLLQKLLDIVKREELVLGMSEAKKMVEFKHPEDLKNILQLNITRDGLNLEESSELLEKIVRYSIKTQHPHFRKLFYHGVDEVGTTAAWLMEAFNTNQINYDFAPVFTLMETHLVGVMARMFGWQEGDGIFCPGGSISNLCAMMLARHNKNPDIKQSGIFNLKPLVAFTSDQSHYSIKKGGSILGLGMDNVVLVQTDSWGRMLPRALKEAVKEARRKGGDPFFVNATGGSTVLGSCDPLGDIADVCQEEELWLHVDACVGGAAIFSKTHKIILKGIERADSIAWNAHKMMCVPLQCALLLTRHMDLLYKCNSVKSRYLYQQDKFYDDNYDLGDKSIQCGRKPDALKLYLALCVYGLDQMEQRVDDAFKAARYLQERIVTRPGFRPVISDEVFCVNTCFWYIPPSLRGQPETQEWWEKLSKVAPKIFERMMTKGTLVVVYQPIVNKTLVNFFRVTPTTVPTPTFKDIDYILDETEKLGEDL
ncbi:cysteine sulfinic acid decarboxylase-like isoform X2 [Homarus americanus]|nr:cysteine sulfinic acid decarboxylase-like isoform X2 [Homarus americanus]